MPRKDITVRRVDFTKAELLEYRNLYAVVLDNVLDQTECDTLVQAAEASSDKGWERAMINIGNGKQQLMEDERNCGRIIWDSPDVAAAVSKRIEHIPEVQEIVRLENVPRVFGNGPAKRGEVWRFSRPNERMRFLRYTGGEYFRPHCDGTYETPDGKERSYFTLHLYLNDAVPTSSAQLATLTPEQQEKAAESTLVGGATTFHSYSMQKRYDVLPQTGRILLFQHRDLIHSGDDVLQGVKYTMRTDLMYCLESGKGENRGKDKSKSKGKGWVESITGGGWSRVPAPEEPKVSNSNGKWKE